MSLFHRDIFMPEAVNAYCGRAYNLYWTCHATRESQSDKLGTIARPRGICFQRGQIIEAEVVKVDAGFSDIRNEVVKLVVRVPYGGKRDLILVLFTEGPRASEMTVGTCWTNLKTDTHTTLRKAVYADKI